MDTVDNTNKNIVITGGMGFIFSHVTEYFIRAGYHVHVIDNLSTGSHPELIEQLKKREIIQRVGYVDQFTGPFTLIELDAGDPKVIPIIETIDPVYIVHAAAISDVDQSIKEPAHVIERNNAATLAVFEAARRVRSLEKLLYVSTDEVYGECDHPKTEDEIIFPKNPYSVSKAFGSLLRLGYDNTYPELRDKTVETRFCNVFGDRQDDRKVIPAIKRALNGGDPLVLHNGGYGYRQYIHVSEIPPVVYLLLRNGSRTYNVTTGEGYTVRELVRMAEQITGKHVPTVEGSRSGMDMRYEMSAERLHKDFGWQPSRSFIDHYKQYLQS